MKIAFLGDIAIFKNGMLKDEKWNIRLAKVREKLSQFDMVIANLEVPLTDCSKTRVCKGIHLKSDKEIIEILKYLNITGVCLANNHICDFGIKGMQDTLELLDKAQIGYFGINNKSWMVKVGNNQLAFHGFCCYSSNGAKYISSKQVKGVNPLTKSAIVAALEEDKKNGCLSIISVHWGDEYSSLPNEKQVEFLHVLSEQYTFILHGHHAHVMQGIEYNNHSLLGYNLGNFCFDECISPINPKLIIKQSPLNRESYILSVEVQNNKIVAWETIGIYYDNFIQIIDNQEKIKVLSSKISHCKEMLYKQESLDIISKQKQNNLVSHNFSWLLSNLNYY